MTDRRAAVQFLATSESIPQLVVRLRLGWPADDVSEEFNRGVSTACCIVADALEEMFAVCRGAKRPAKEM